MSRRTLRYDPKFKFELPTLDAAVQEEEDEDDEEDEQEETIYFAICANDQVGLARMLKDEDLDPNFTFNGENQLQKSILHLCCEKGFIGCAQLLIDSGAKLNIRDKWEQTPLMYAICTERLEMVQMMIAAGADLDRVDRVGESVLHYTVGHESTDCMQAMLEAGADIDVGDNLRRTPLWGAAAKDGHEQALVCLLEHGADVMIRDRREKRTPLHAAVAHTNKDTITYMQRLTRAGASVNVTDEFGHSCVMTLLRRCALAQRDFVDEDKKKVAYLLEAGHDIDLIHDVVNPALWYQYHDTALNLAIAKDLVEATTFLLQAGADPNKYSGHKFQGQPSEPPLITATRSNSLPIMCLLVQAGANLGIRVPADVADPLTSPSMLQPTAFQLAIEQEAWQCVELFLQAGYDLQNETYLLTNQDVPDQLVLNLDLWSRLIDLVTTPRPLILHCRDAVRRYLGQKLHQTVVELPLPVYLKDVLLLQHLDVCV